MNSAIKVYSILVGLSLLTSGCLISQKVTGSTTITGDVSPINSSATSAAVVYFMCADASNMINVCNYSEGTGKVSQLSSGDPGKRYVEDFWPQNTTVANKNLYYTGYDIDGYRKLFRTDVDKGVVQVTNMKPGGHDDFTYPTGFGNSVYFVSGGQVMKVDSSNNLTGLNNTVGNNPQTLFTAAGKLYGNDASTSGVFVLNSKGTGIYRPNSEKITQVFPTSKHLFVSKPDAKGLNKLFVLSGSSYVQVMNNQDGKDDYIDSRYWNANSISPFKEDSLGNAYFVSNDVNGNEKLYQISPDASKVTQISDTSPGSKDSINWLSISGDRVVFTAYNENGQMKLFSFKSGDKQAVQISNINDGNDDNIQWVGSNLASIFFVLYQSMIYSLTSSGKPNDITIDGIGYVQIPVVSSNAYYIINYSAYDDSVQLLQGTSHGSSFIDMGSLFPWPKEQMVVIE